MEQNISRRDDLLLEVVRSAEETALQLRSYAAVIHPPYEHHDAPKALPLPIRMEITPEQFPAWLETHKLCWAGSPKT